IDVGKQSRAEQVLQRLVDPLGVERIAWIELHVRPNGLRLDALIAFDADFLDRLAPRNGLRNCTRRGQVQGAEDQPCDQRKPSYQRHAVSTPQVNRALNLPMTFRKTKSFQVANSMTPSTKAMPIRKPHSCIRSPSGFPRTASIT